MSSTDGLPDSFDVIVLGTGLTESIVAAACARVGLSVLHVDKNDYYGGPWANLNLQAYQQWITDQQKSSDVLECKADAVLRDGEKFLPCTTASSPFFDLCEQWHVAKRPPTLEPLPEQTVIENSQLCPANAETVNSDGEIVQSDSQSGPAEQSADSNTPEEKVSNDEHEVAGFKHETPKSKPVLINSRDDVECKWRAFSLDLSPKLLCGRGPMVQLLINSGVGRYAEFKCVDRILTHFDGYLQQVPCSRSDVFQSQQVSMIEKRRLMKFVTFCLNYEQQRSEWEDYEQRPFAEFLATRDLSPLLTHYIMNAIGMAVHRHNTADGLQAVHKFVMSVGRFGNSPFLFTLYGSGELPQCFCRLCAVFGGVYCLRKPIDGWIVDADGTTVAIVTEGQRIACNHLVAERTHLPQQLLDAQTTQQAETIHRAILITDKSIKSSDAEHVSLLNYHPEEAENAVRLLELGAGSMVSPKGVFVVYLTTKSRGDAKAQDLFRPIIDQFFVYNVSADGPPPALVEKNKPTVIWSSYFSYNWWNAAEANAGKWENVAVVSWPDDSFDYELAANEATDIFKRFWPDHDFLPTPPEPEESGFPDTEHGLHDYQPTAELSDAVADAPSDTQIDNATAQPSLSSILSDSNEPDKTPAETTKSPFDSHNVL